jgi:hypothetical protein
MVAQLILVQFVEVRILAGQPFFFEASYFPLAQNRRACFYVGPWRSLVAHLHGVQGVASSNLVGPTIYLS